MKTNTIIKLAALLFTFNFSLLTAFAQSPEKMTYQAVIRNASDQLVTNQDMGMQISILQGSAGGTAVYVETHSSSSNENGLVTVEIGTGTTSDDFSAIDWNSGPYFLKTETDPTTAGGTNYTITGTNQLLSVPYALYSKESGISGNISPWLPSGDNIYYNAGNVGIGIDAPTSALEVAGVLKLDGSTTGFFGLKAADNTGSTIYTLPSVDGSDGQVLSTDGSGMLSWQDGDNLGNHIAIQNIDLADFKLVGYGGTLGLTVDISGNGIFDGIITEINGNSNNWNDAYSWGDHSLEAYLTEEVDGSIINETITNINLNGTSLEITEAGNTNTVDLSSLQGGGVSEFLGEVRMFALSETGAVTKSSLQGEAWAICDGTTSTSQGITGAAIENTPDLRTRFIRMSNDETSGGIGGSDHHNHQWNGSGAGTVTLDASGGGDAPGSFNSSGGIVEYNTGDLDIACYTANVNTYPRYYELAFFIKVK